MHIKRFFFLLKKYPIIDILWSFIVTIFFEKKPVTKEIFQYIENV